MSNILKVAFPGGVVYQATIKENQDKMAEEYAKEIVHEALKIGWGIA